LQEIKTLQRGKDGSDKLVEENYYKRRSGDSDGHCPECLIWKARTSVIGEIIKLLRGFVTT